MLGPEASQPKEVDACFKLGVVEETRVRAGENIRVRDDFDISTWQEPWWGVASIVYRSTYVTPLQRHSFKSIVAGTYPSAAQMKKWGYDCTGLCECGEAVFA